MSQLESIRFHLFCQSNGVCRKKFKRNQLCLFTVVECVTIMSTEKDPSLEAHSFVWLDHRAQNSPNPAVLRSKIHNLVIFHHADPCVEYINELSPSARVVLILCAGESRTSIARFHELSQVYSIYIYGNRSTRNEPSVETYPKVNARKRLINCV